MQKDLKKKIISKVKAKKNSKKVSVISPFKLKTEKKNQFVVFFKPESFIDKEIAEIENILDLAFKKFDEYQIEIAGVAHFPGASIGEFSIMDRHYGVINKLSKNASKLVTDEERKQIITTLGITNVNIKILGGHEAHKISGMSEFEFDKYWLSSASTKIRSGFYVRPMKVADEEIIVVNGFHPNQLVHYTHPDHSLIVMLLNSDTKWAQVRDEMLGTTFPDKALAKSFRGSLFKNPKKFGFDRVGIDNNVMHISAGPTEALFEMDNFLNNGFGMNIIESDATLPSKLIKEGFKPQEINDLINKKDVHDALEHKDIDEAIEFLKTYRNS